MGVEARPEHYPFSLSPLGNHEDHTSEIFVQLDMTSH